MRIRIRPHSGRFFIFGHSPKHYRLRTSAFLIGLPAMHLLLATRERVFWVVHTQLIALVISFQLISDVFFYGFSILSYRINIWSGHTSPSIISTPFHWHNVRNIYRISKRFSSKNTFRRYFGANTIWYLQFHFVCAKLLLALKFTFSQTF